MYGQISHTQYLCLCKYRIQKTMSEQLSHTRKLCGEISHRNILYGEISQTGKLYLGIYGVEDKLNLMKREISFQSGAKDLAIYIR